MSSTSGAGSRSSSLAGEGVLVVGGTVGLSSWNSVAMHSMAHEQAQDEFALNSSLLVSRSWM